MEQEDPIQHAAAGKGLVEFTMQYRWGVILATILALLLFFRFFLVQILRGESYERLARISYIGQQRIPARRGNIIDQQGRVLAQNAARYDIAVVPHYLEKSLERLRRERIRAQGPHKIANASPQASHASPAVNESEDNPLWRLRQLLSLSAAEYEAIALKVQENLTKERRFNKLVILRDIVSDRCPEHGVTLEQAPEQVALWCPACGHSYRTIDPTAAVCPQDQKPLLWDPLHRIALCSRCGTTFIVGGRCPEDDAQLERRASSLRCPICQKYFDNQYAIVNANLHRLPGLSIETLLRRQYPYHRLLGHVVGYTNEVNEKDIDQFPDQYQRGDFRGRVGLEATFETTLRGVNGDLVFYKDARGLPEASIDVSSGALGSLKSTEAIAGDNIQLTIDIALQRMVANAFREHRSGAVVVMDPRNGHILAIHSKPGFDPNEWSGRLTPQRYKGYMDNPFGPMMNKALLPYAPGSVYKVVTALIALHEGVITPDTRFECGGHYDFGGRKFRCHDHHGQPNLEEALKVSCDVYFYRLGEMLGMERMERYAREVFGIGQPTGVEIRERVGRVPSKEWHRKYSPNGWQPGFTLSTAVGQGDLLTSPLEMARVYAAIVNGGRLLKAHMVLQITDPDGNVTRRFMPEQIGTLPFSKEHLDIIRRGLFRTVNEEGGTAYKSRLDSVIYGGKTGTAEAAQHRAGATPEVAQWLKQDHAWFVGFAPVNDPEILVVVFAEHGGSGGKEAAPVAARIIQDYFTRGFARHQDALETPPATTETPQPAASVDDAGPNPDE